MIWMRSSPPSSCAIAQVSALSIHISGVMQRERAVHAERDRFLERPDRLVAAIGIPRVVRLAHAADERMDAAPIAQGGGIREEEEIAAGHERRRQPGGRHFDLGFARQRRLAQDPSSAISTMWSSPRRLAQRPNLSLRRPEYDMPLLELDRVALTVVETDRLDSLEALECPGETDRAVLPAGEENES